jgi:hypothetical protein
MPGKKNPYATTIDQNTKAQAARILPAAIEHADMPLLGLQ